jgi:hypothetical protein
MTDKIKFNIWDKVSIDFSKKHYDGKSVRRGIMDKLIEHCMGLSVTNTAKYVVGMRYLLDYDMDRVDPGTQIIKDFQEGKRRALPRISDEKRKWIRTISSIMYNFKYAVVIGVELCPHHLSEICPSHIYYHEDRIDKI